LLALAREVEEGLRAGEPAIVDERMDVDRLLQRATRGLPVSKTFIDKLTASARQSGLGLGGVLLGAKEESRQVRLLRVQEREGAPRALFRVLSASADLNYFELELGHNARGEAVIVDVFPYMSGELYSESLRSVYLMSAVDAGQCTAKKPCGPRGLQGNMPRLWRIRRLFDAGEYQQVVEELAQLPPDVLAQRALRIIRLNALSHVDEAEYQRALQAFEKAFPGDPMLVLRSLGDARLSGRPAAMMRVIERLDARVKDPYLQYLRGVVKLEQADDAGAKRLFQDVVRAEPTLIEPYVVLFTLAIQERDHAEAVRLLDALERDAGADVTSVSVEGSLGVESFLRSPEYKAWLERRLRPKHRGGRSFEL
jgi:tetratricopeptide (TPR) repeat protein